MTESRQICCCNLSSWTKTIAWLDLVFAMFGVSSMGMILFYWEEQDIAAYYPLDIHNTDHRLVIFVLASSLICFTKGLLLLQGVNQGYPSYLMMWIILTVMWLSMTVVYKLMTLKVVLVAMEIVVIFIVVGFTGFIIWLVQLYRIDIKLSQLDHNVVRVLYK